MDSRHRRSLLSFAAVTVSAAAVLAGSPGPATATSHPSQLRHQTTQPPADTISTASVLASSASAVPRNVRLVRTRTSLLGTHEWYRQVRHGRDVVGAWWVRHIDSKGRVTIWDGRKTFSKVQPAVAKVSVQRATDTAAKAASAPLRTADASSLMVLPTGQGSAARLVWPVTTATGRGATTAYVDAGTGRILKSITNSKTWSAATQQVKGRGRVFDPNPVVKLQDESLKDQHDAASAVPRSAYTMVNLPRLNGSHSLAGRWVRIVNSDRATSSNNRYIYNRGNDKFEQVNAYHAVDAEQHYLQKLGFRDVNSRSQKVLVNAFPDDNSYYNPANHLISLGSGGVDDAEDPEVIWHESGHAIQADQVLDFGWSRQAKAIGEGFGDYMAVTMSQARATGTKTTPLACVMDWDSTSYTFKSPHCLRRTDTNLKFPADLTGEPHADGQIWSRALWDINRSLGRDTATTIIIEAQFWMNPKITMPQAARITISTAQTKYGDATAAAVRTAFTRRGIL